MHHLLLVYMQNNHWRQWSPTYGHASPQMKGNAGPCDLNKGHLVFRIEKDVLT